MDIVFNCPKCEQELAVDSTAAGSEIVCPTCRETIVIPEPPAVPGSGGPGEPQVVVNPLNVMSTSAAAKVEMHLKVPVREGPAESLIGKPLKPLEVAAKETDKRIRIKTIRHTDCIEVGHDRFDEVVSDFLFRVGEEHIISINPINYTNLDIGTQKLMTEYGVMVVYKG
jgi:DNA-directed RNA polymerase subunit RPC12/RpoP